MFPVVAARENSIVPARLSSALVAVESFVLLLVVLYFSPTAATTFSSSVLLST
jgi:hypothetical protein